MIEAWQRADGRKGIRNTVAVAYLVECAHHVARRIVDKADDPDVHLIGFPGCYPNAYAAKVMEAVATHPNVGGLVIVSLAIGDKVIKYGAPIGSMTAAADTGDWVHMHNMKSDYIASHTRSTVTEQRA